MNSHDLYFAFNEVDEDILLRSETAVANHRIMARRRFGIVLIAAILALFMLGAGVATIWGSDIQSWFARYWETITGQPMSDGHSALIDRLSQEINQSQTVGNVTVTVDSATIGESNFFILLRIEGLEFSKKHRYGFEEEQVILAPESIADNMTSASFSYNYWGLAPDGAAILLIHYSYATSGPIPETPPSLRLTLSMENLVQDPRTTNKHLLLAEGLWSFTFTLDRNTLETIMLPDTQVRGIDYSKPVGQRDTPVMLTNMALTGADLTFRYVRQGGNVVADIALRQVRIILKNGQEIYAHNGAKTIMDGDQWHCVYFWEIPVDLNEVAAVRIGDVVIPVE